MPSATDELRGKICERFGSIDLLGPQEHLRAQGYSINHGLITLPNPIHRVTESEGDCIDFLCDEWDYDFPKQGNSGHG
jgi:hypothetical protein